jgi:hypothetical protein
MEGRRNIARVPDEEIDRLKRETDLAGLVRASGRVMVCEDWDGFRSMRGLYIPTTWQVLRPHA